MSNVTRDVTQPPRRIIKHISLLSLRIDDSLSSNRLTLLSSVVGGWCVGGWTLWVFWLDVGEISLSDTIYHLAVFFFLSYLSGQKTAFFFMAYSCYPPSPPPKLRGRAGKLPGASLVAAVTYWCFSTDAEGSWWMGEEFFYRLANNLDRLVGAEQQLDFTNISLKHVISDWLCFEDFLLKRGFDHSRTRFFPFIFCLRPAARTGLVEDGRLVWYSH